MEDLIQIVDAAVEDAARRSGAHLVCRSGCASCCTGVFAISHRDAARLRNGLQQLAQSDPQRAARVKSRVAASIARLTPEFPGNLSTGVLHEDADSRAFFDEVFANDEVCAALDPGSNTCDLYTTRPILCRTFGPPARDEDGNLGACELCYTTATVDEIAACVLDPAISAIEEAENQAFNREHGLGGETIVAYALHSQCRIGGA